VGDGLGGAGGRGGGGGALTAEEARVSFGGGGGSGRGGSGGGGSVCGGSGADIASAFASSWLPEGIPLEAMGRRSDGVRATPPGLTNISRAESAPPPAAAACVLPFGTEAAAGGGPCLPRMSSESAAAGREGGEGAAAGLQSVLDGSEVSELAELVQRAAVELRSLRTQVEEKRRREGARQRPSDPSGLGWAEAQPCPS
jgi:hypothetical protein